MEKYKILLRPAWKKQKFSVLSIFFIMFILSLFLFTSLVLYNSGALFVEKEMDRLGFGDFTVWVSNYPQGLENSVREIKDTGEVKIQDIIYAGYEANGHYSDNEGQLMYYSRQFPYHFINEKGERIPGNEAASGTIYVSPVMQSLYNIKTGDSITFEILRTYGKKTFTVAGFFEDAFMGSSMIDMKSFIINSNDYNKIKQEIKIAKKGDILAKSGAMFHISKSGESNLKDAMFYQKLIEETEISRYTEFTYKKSSILNYMLLLQNILAGFLSAFSIILFIVCIIIINHSINMVIAQEKRDIAILKTTGLNGRVIQNIYIFLYSGSAITGIITGVLFCGIIPGKIAKEMLISTGMLIDIKIPVVKVLLIIIAMVLFNIFNVYVKTAAVLAIHPIQVINGIETIKYIKTHIGKKYLSFNIAVREVMTGRKKYMALFFVSALLVFFTGIINNINNWLGKNGEGLMDAFSVAAHDIGVQPFNNNVPMDEIERVINWYSPVINQYELAMESVTVNGYGYTANILNDTKWFNILSGKEPEGNEILITNTVANELGIGKGSTVKISAQGREAEYKVSGIYECANGMGTNIGMTVPGYSQIGDITGFIWCYHYILEDGSMRDYVYKYLEEHYKETDVHTNSWQGLDGIVKVMHMAVFAVYIIAVFIIFIVTSLIASKIFLSEIHGLAVYRSLGITGMRLIMVFAMQFFIVALPGAAAGSILQILFGRKLIRILFNQFGIGEFKRLPVVFADIIPFLAVPAIFLFFALIYSRKLKSISIIDLIEQNEE